MSEHPDLIIGSSMGGMMAEQMHGYDRILVNPAFQMGDTMGSHGMVGKVTFQNPRRDGIQETVVTKQMQKEYREVTEDCFAACDDDAEQQHVWGLFGDRDPIVHTREIFQQHYRQGVSFHGEHRLVDSIVHHSLLPVIRWVDDRQEGRQREVVYIECALAEADGEAASSADQKWSCRNGMRKVVEELLDRYEVFFVTTAPTNDRSRYDRFVAELEEFIGVPAWGHAVMTNRTDLLYGDFLLTPYPPKDAMATVIELGAPEFKGWEDVSEYFSRL